MSEAVIYLCGPINGCTDAEANDWRSLVKSLLPEYECLDPMRRDYRGREHEDGIAAEIVNGDTQDVKACDVLLAFCPKPSVGTSMEILFGNYILGKAVLTIVPEGAPLSPWLKHFSKVITKTEREACDWIRANYPPGWKRPRYATC